MNETQPLHLATEANRLEAGAALLRFFQSCWQQGGEYRASIETILAEYEQEESVSSGKDRPLHKEKAASKTKESNEHRD